MQKIKKIIARTLGNKRPFSSQDYWQGRYAGAGNSGSGSYGRLADHKADVLNRFVTEHNIERVVELGSGDGNQLSLANYPAYVGIDVSPAAVALCEERFRDHDDYRFLRLPEVDWKTLAAEFRPQLVLSLDVLFHLIEDDVFDTYMTNLFRFENATVAIYSSNGNFSVAAPHIRNHTFTDWIERHAPEWELTGTVPNPYPWDESDPDNTSFSNFYYYRRKPG